MAKDKKYKLIRAGRMPVNQREDWRSRRFYQLVALRDIPLHNVKAGDLGGYVSDRHILSHEGNCWIGEEAQVIGSVSVTGDAYIGEHALVYNFLGYPFVVKENARITGNSASWLYQYIDTSNSDIIPPALKCFIGGNAHISGEARLINVSDVSGFAKIHGNATLNGVEVITGNVEVSGKAQLETGVKLLGDAVISGEETVIGSNSVIRDCIVSNVNLESYSEFSDQILDAEGFRFRDVQNTPISSESSGKEFTSSESKMSSKSKRILAVYNEVLEGIASYEADIVKLIKYPVMSDRTDPYTRAMVKCVKEAQHYAGEPASDDFAEAVRALEDAFLAAESNAIKVLSTSLSDAEKKKTELAKDLFAVASNDSSSENEKKVAFKQGFKNLEGVITVPEKAIDAFRIKVGLKELEV